MADSLAAVVLSAGSGTRLLPLTRLRPKVLCPVNGRPLLDHAMESVVGLTDAVAVNVHADRASMEAHLRARHPQVHMSVEPVEERGTAGAVGLLRPWLDGRDVVIVNGDTWAPGTLTPLLDGWDRERIRIFAHGADRFGERMLIAGSVLPWADAARLTDEPTGLYEVCWKAAHEADRVEVIRHDGPFVDCATPADYLRANMEASGGATVVGDGAVVDGEARESVLWPGVRVRRGERLHRAIRASDTMTVLVR
jgi:NDP-sugar pyrophosphorylase family protein